MLIPNIATISHLSGVAAQTLRGHRGMATWQVSDVDGHSFAMVDAYGWHMLAPAPLELLRFLTDDGLVENVMILFLLDALTRVHSSDKVERTVVKPCYS